MTLVQIEMIDKYKIHSERLQDLTSLRREKGHSDVS